MRLPFLIPILASILGMASPALADPPKVVASIKPIHSLVAGVMEGVGEPALLVKGAASPHTYALRPSDARVLESADLVFWVGPHLESFLTRPLKSLGGSARPVPLMKAGGLILLENREGGAWEGHDHGHGHSHGHPPKEEEINTHIWLDPVNAKRIVAVAAEALAGKDPANAATYQANAAKVTARLDTLDSDLKAVLAPVAGKPFVVFHDAYPYFEKRYGLTAVGAISLNPEQRPSAKRLSEIRARIKGLKAVCVFAEPQFEPKLVDTLVEGTTARKGVLDPEGADIPDGPDLYFTLLRNLAASLTGCLGG